MAPAPTGEDPYALPQKPFAGAVRPRLLLERFAEVLGQPVGNWSALEDRLRLAIFEAPGEEYALLWTDAHRMLEGGLPGLVTAADLCYRMARTREDHGHRFRAFFVGDGPNFR